MKVNNAVTDNRQVQSSKKRMAILAVVLSLFVLLTWVTVGFYPYYKYYNPKITQNGSNSIITGKDDFSKPGAFGDSFGFVNSLFSGLAFAGVIYAILLQREELKLQRIDIEDSRKVLKQSVEEAKRLAELTERQNKISETLMEMEKAKAQPDFSIVNDQGYTTFPTEKDRAFLLSSNVLVRVCGAEITNADNPSRVGATYILDPPKRIKAGKYVPIELYGGRDFEVRIDYVDLYGEKGHQFLRIFEKVFMVVEHELASSLKNDHDS